MQTIGKTIALTRWIFVGRVMFLLFNMLCRLVIAFLPRSKCLLISWLQCPSAMIRTVIQRWYRRSEMDWASSECPALAFVPATPTDLRGPRRGNHSLVALVLDNHPDPVCLEHRLLSVHAEPGNTAVSPLLSEDAPSLFSRAQQPRACWASPPLRSVACCPVTFMLVLFHIFFI